MRISTLKPFVLGHGALALTYIILYQKLEIPLHYTAITAAIVSIAFATIKGKAPPQEVAPVVFMVFIAGGMSGLVIAYPGAQSEVLSIFLTAMAFYTAGYFSCKNRWMAIIGLFTGGIFAYNHAQGLTDPESFGLFTFATFIYAGAISLMHITIRVIQDKATAGHT